METKILLTANLKVRLQSKPTSNKEVGAISRDLTSEGLISINQFAKGVVNGRVFCPAIFDGTRSNNNWASQQLFGLDFDSGVTPEEIIKRLELYSLVPNVVYSTFSDKPEHRKFRVMIAIDEVIIDKSERDWIANTLLEIFPESDKSTKDAARLFYPGKELLLVNDVLVSYTHFKEVLESFTPKPNQEVLNKPRMLTSREYSEDYIDQALKLVSNYMRKHNINFYQGNKHTHNIRYAAMCNQFGIPEQDCINELIFRGEYSSKTSYRVKDVYKRYSSQFSIKNATNDLRMPKLSGKMDIEQFYRALAC